MLSRNSQGLGRRAKWLLALCLASPVAVPVAAEDAPTRAADLQYGRVLYHYHQGEAFDALTLMAVANARGGIQGHGDHPELVEGGLMLSYGMNREAERRFAALLDDERPGVGPEVRNQAWFYLGKVYYLDGDWQRAYDSLQRVDAERLGQADPELLDEWHYLSAELARRVPEFGGPAVAGRLAERLSADSLWRAYLDYNLAMDQVAAGETSAAEQRLTALLPRFDVALADDDPSLPETVALADQIRLSLGRLMLLDKRFDQALAVFDGISADGPLSDRALFEYAVAAASAGAGEKALGVLNLLSERALFTPWLQQVHYARGYLLEQAGRLVEALAAYRQAASHYEEQMARLETSRGALDEASLMAALQVERDSSGPITDAYGRLRVLPADPGLASTLASESFQQALSELTELYQLQDHLDHWQTQLASFDIMLETRRQQRAQRIAETETALSQQQADYWAQQHKSFRERIDGALERGDETFFMSTEQMALAQRLKQVEQTLAKLPADARTQRQRATFRRMQAHFQWMVADDYGINRWAAQKQLRELDAAMAEFQARRERLAVLMSEDQKHQQYLARLADATNRLQVLRGELASALSASRQRLLAQVDQDLQQRVERNRRYLVASRHAQARLADQLFRQQSSLPGAGQ